MTLIFVLLIAVVALGVWWWIHGRTAGSDSLPAMESVIRLLKSEKMRFLVTDCVEQQVTLRVRGGNLLLGRRDGFVVAVCRWYGGVDFDHIEAADLTQRGNTILVSVPEPAVLDVAIETDTIRLMTKVSGLQAIRDQVRDRNLREDLVRRLRREALRSAEHDNLLPGREEIVRRLNKEAEALCRAVNVKVRFK